MKLPRTLTLFSLIAAAGSLGMVSIPNAVMPSPDGFKNMDPVHFEVRPDTGSNVQLDTAGADAMNAYSGEIEKAIDAYRAFAVSC